MKLLITGGTGSFGKTALNYLLKAGEYEEIRVFSRDEEKQFHLRNSLGDERVKFYIGDIRDEKSIDIALEGVQHVFHAAALKQVPSCEFFPIEAIKTNILGSQNVLSACRKNKVLKAVFLSTDKAVMPINAMGISKSMMEKLVLANHLTHDSDLIASTVRYGNVLLSRGSVIPFFVQQIKSGLPITITDPAMTRFLLPLNNAMTLVKHALDNGADGDLFVKKSPAATVETIAKSIAKLLGKTHEVKVIGTRLGEKKHEVLLSENELHRADDQGDYYKVCPASEHINYDEFFTKGVDATYREYASNTTEQLDEDQVINLLLAETDIKSLI